MRFVTKGVLEVIKEGKREIDILCGTLNPDFYNSLEFCEIIKNFLGLENSKLILLFNGQEEKIESIINKNKKLNASLFRILEEFNQKASVYLMPFIAKRQYIISDKNLIIQGDHEPGKNRDVYFFNENDELSNCIKWRDSFYKMIEKSERLNLV